MPTWLDKILNSQSVQFALAALAFLIALWLVVVIARMLMGGRLKLPGGRNRQPRLGIVDAFDLDRQRQLIIVRRDNTEHLIMIGGPNDLLIESEILRVEAREFRDGRRDKMLEPVVDTRMAGDGRIPAPMGVAGNGEGYPTAAPRADEPLLPMPLPQTASPAPAAPPQAMQPVPEQAAVEPLPPPRAPTFPLPPRRPTATPTIADRRPPVADRAAPSADRAPGEPYADRPQRSAGPGLNAGAESAPFTPAPGSAAGPSAPPDASLPPQTPKAANFGAADIGAADIGAAEAGAPDSRAPDAGAPIGPGATTAADRFARPQRPAPYLKPLPPRPPIRPLRRITPQAEPPAAARPATEPVETAPANNPAEAPAPVEARAPTLPPNAPPVLPPAATPAAPAHEAPPAEKDALESLEEEMAKLLGRGN